MTASPLVTIWCDGIQNDAASGLERHAPGCSLWVSYAPRASAARSEAREAGWKTSQPGGSDYSPECWATRIEVR